MVTLAIAGNSLVLLAVSRYNLIVVGKMKMWCRKTTYRISYDFKYSNMNMKHSCL